MLLTKNKLKKKKKKQNRKLHVNHDYTFAFRDRWRQKGKLEGNAHKTKWLSEGRVNKLEALSYIF